jgi:CRP-like cAMP-binding protein
MPIATVLARARALQGLALSPFELAAQSSLVTLDRGSRLFKKGESPKHVFVVRSGVVKLARTLGWGQCTRGLFGAGSVIGALASLAKAPYATDSLVISSRAELVLVPAAVFERALLSSDSLAERVATLAWEEQRWLFDKIDIMSSGRAESRVAALLCRLDDDLGDEEGMIPPAMSRRELSRFVGTSAEVVVRTMTRWTREELVLTTKRGLAIRDRNRLEHLAHDPRAEWPRLVEEKSAPRHRVPREIAPSLHSTGT